MDRKTIILKIQDVFRDIFDDENIILSEDTNANDIEDWDSLAQINIVVTLEKIFNIKFNVEEIITLKCVGDIIDAIINK